ncbi:MAG: FAD-dependent oxidoreductase [Clostridiales bacterium]|nr:FAD-dependent oxidoreductase [Clostridiales bacterium]
MHTLEWKESIPVAGEYDVIVAGGGLSGVAAALSAARLHKKVLLLEKSTMLGGLATLGLINLWVPLCNGRGKQVIKGMAEELLRLSIEKGFDTLPEEWKEGEPKEPTEKRYVTKFSIGIFALQLVKLLKDTGVTILYDALVSSPVMENGHCMGLIIDGKSGRQFYGAKMVVDATGDADVLLRAGVPTVDGRNFFTMIAYGVNLKSCQAAVEKGDIAAAYARFSGGPSSLYGKGHPEDMPLFWGASTEMVNDFLQKNQLQMYENIKDQPRKERDVLYLPGMAQLRTTRHIDGDYTLSMDDLYKHQETSIGAICDFDYRDRLYEVPFGTLVRTGFDNLITCGRSAAAKGWAWDALRVIPPAVLTGQAAGIAAAQAIDAETAIHDLPITPLQKALADTGVIIHFDDAWIPENPEAVHAETDGHL